jgi:hypothetical protein
MTKSSKLLRRLAVALLLIAIVTIVFSLTLLGHRGDSSTIDEGERESFSDEISNVGTVTSPTPTQSPETPSGSPPSEFTKLPEETSTAGELSTEREQVVQSITVRANPLGESTGAAAQDASGEGHQLKDWSQAVEVELGSGGCKSCWRTNGSLIRIPNECEYESHTISQIRRIPLVSIEIGSDDSTEYEDILDRDAKGRIHTVQLRVRIHKTSASSVDPLISMRLRVVAKCPVDAVVIHP